MSDIERIPSMRKSPRQGVPRRPTRPAPARAMARPVTKSAGKQAPPPAPALEVIAEPAPSEEPTVSELPIAVEEPTLPAQQELPAEAPAEAPAEPEPPAEPPIAELLEPAAPQQPAQVEPEPLPTTVREMLQWVDSGWLAFRSAAFRFPSERMNEHLGDDGWTRKQMLAHIAAWHDLAADRLAKMAITGRSVSLDDDDDAINARVARQAIGKTAGEVLKDIEATFSRLRRRLSSMTDAQLRADHEWAAQVVAGNTYRHYAEHLADLRLPEPAEGLPRR